MSCTDELYDPLSTGIHIGFIQLFFFAIEPAMALMLLPFRLSESVVSRSSVDVLIIFMMLVAPKTNGILYWPNLWQ